MSFSDMAAVIAPQRAFSDVPDTASPGATAQTLIRQLRDAMQADDAGDLDFTVLQQLFAAMCEFYAADVTARERITPINTIDGASPTAVLMTTTGLLRGANLELFELGMWQTWSGMK